MAEWRLQFSDAWAPRIVDALCANFGYRDVVYEEDENGNYMRDPDTNEWIMVPNPQTRPQFAKWIVGQWMKGQVVKHEGPGAASETQATKEAEVETGLEIT